MVSVLTSMIDPTARPLVRSRLSRLICEVAIRARDPSSMSTVTVSPAPGVFRHSLRVSVPGQSLAELVLIQTEPHRLTNEVPLPERCLVREDRVVQGRQDPARKDHERLGQRTRKPQGAHRCEGMLLRQRKHERLGGDAQRGQPGRGQSERRQRPCSQELTAAGALMQRDHALLLASVAAFVSIENDSRRD